MTPTDDNEILRQLVDPGWTCCEAQPVSGGCISEGRRCRVRDRSGKTFWIFWKKNDESFDSNFQCEAIGLELLRKVGAIRTPEVFGHGIAGGRSHLFMEWIEPNHRSIDDAELGRRLARHHQMSLRSTPGLDHDNFLGATRQRNLPLNPKTCTNPQTDPADWVTFTRTNRIEPQIEMAKSSGLLDPVSVDLLDQVISRLPELLSSRSQGYSLLHGDLWSGNLLFDASRQPAWIDPAAWFGCREAEFGMIRLFGGRSSAFMDAYQATYPMADGWQRHAGVYVAYHLLNHVNLFGSSYLGSLRSTLGELLAS